MDDKKIRTSDGGLGGKLSMSPSSISSNFSKKLLIHGSGVAAVNNRRIMVLTHNKFYL